MTGKHIRMSMGWTLPVLSPSTPRLADIVVAANFREELQAEGKQYGFFHSINAKHRQLCALQ